MKHRDFWPAPTASTRAPLAFLMPGGSGTRRPCMRGFDAMAALLWFKGFSVYVFDNPPEPYSMKTFCSMALNQYLGLCRELDPSHVLLHGSCVGGAFAAHLAADTLIPNDRKILALWETPLEFPPELNRKLVDLAKAAGVVFADESVVNIAHVHDKVCCPVHVGYGKRGCQPLCDSVGHEIFNESTLGELRTSLINAPEVEASYFDGADHSLTRGSNRHILMDYVFQVMDFARARGFPLEGHGGCIGLRKEGLK